jgi:hypothetical protein
MASTYFWAVVASSGDPDGGPSIAANRRNVAITTRLFRIGANIGAANRRCACSRPIAIAPIP